MEKMKDLISKLLLKNRTIVTSDNHECMKIISTYYDVSIHRYPSGTDHGTWIIPDEWNLKKAELKDQEGKVLVSLEDSPLFVARYSLPFKGEITKDEIVKHCFVD